MRGFLYILQYLRAAQLSHGGKALGIPALSDIADGDALYARADKVYLLAAGGDLRAEKEAFDRL